MIDFLDTLIDQFKQQVSTNQFLSGGLILGMATGILMYFKSVPLWIWGRIKRKITFKVTIDQADPMYAYLQNWLNKNHHQQLRNVKANFYRTKNTNSNNEGLTSGSQEKYTFVKANEIVYNHYGDHFTIFYHGRFLRLHSEKEKIENASNLFNLFFESFFIEGLLAEKAIKELLQEVIDDNLEEEKNKQFPKILINIHSSWRTDRDSRMRSIDSIFIPSEKKEFIINDVSNFIKDKEFYIKRNIPYRRGYMLYGPPGTGKSSLASAIASYFKKDLYIMNMDGFSSNGNFEDCLRDVNSGILLIEDIDRYKFGGEDKVEFSTFLNAISGVRAKEDLILIITTNHASELDAAMIRAGRIDVKLEISLPSLKEVNAYLSWFYDRPIEISEFNGNMADVENACVMNKHDYKKAVLSLLPEYKSNGHKVFLDK